MNIAFLNSIEKETYGGMEEWIRLVATGLVARGHEAALLGRTGSRFLDRVGKSVPSADSLPLNISGDFDPIVINRIRTYLAERAIDILCVNFNKDVRLGGIAARINNTVRVVWSLGMNIAKDKLSHRLLTPRLIDAIIVPSEALKEEIVGLGFLNRDCVNVIPIGIEDISYGDAESLARDSLRKKYNLPPDAVIALTVARLVYKKGHEYLIDAAPAIIGDYPNLYFLFLGDGPKEKVLRDQVRDLNLSDRFVFAGMLDNIDLELAGSDLMIHPAKEEPFGIALLEGMRAGLPIVASRVGGIPEVVADGECGILVQPRSPEAVSLAVRKLLAEPERMKRLGQNGRRRWAEQFRYSTMVKRVEHVFQSTLDHRSHLTSGVGV
ncbi:MAG: glycosyltransferase family 4 protein [Candidatus Zixiibacteriota bacterium]|nr:MAG: glycosyltransferase family 4 protein [candidate division Zixibacteria bacterium]